MCGLAGYSGIVSSFDRQNIVFELGWGIDDRGGDAAGFVTVSHTLRYCKRVGMWSGAKNRFIKAAATGHLTMMHSRWATCGVKSLSEAHPFVIRRNGKTVLYGAHNGIIYDAWESAKKNGRNIEVDSQEIFELIADGKFAEIAELGGYGVLTWIYANNPTVVNIVRMTKNSEIEAAKLKSGGIVWASTSKILRAAVKSANLEIEVEYDLKEIGTVYQIEDGEITMSTLPAVKLAESISLFSSSWLGSAFSSRYSKSSTSSSSSPHSDYGSIDMHGSIDTTDITNIWDSYLKEVYGDDAFDHLSEDEKDTLYELHAEELSDLDEDDVVGDEDDYHLTFASEEDDESESKDNDRLTLEDLDRSWDRWMKDDSEDDAENAKDPFYYKG